MVKYLIRLLPAVAVAAFAAGPDAAVTTSQSALPVVGSLRSSIEFAGETVDGDFSALVPLYSSLGQSGRLNGSMVFAEPYAEWVERGSVQAGLGLGFRHLFGEQPLSAFSQQAHAGFLDEGIYIGANAFLDMAETRYDQRFWQLGLGAEVGTRYIELRGRYHIPLDNGEESQVRSVTTYRNDFHDNYGGARLVGSSTVTVDSLFSFLTEGLEGWDAEASVLVPGLDQWVDLRLIGGYASFHSQTFDAIDYDTWKAGIEFRPVPAVVLSGMWFEDERLVGDNWLFGIGLELPFETADIGDGKSGFWGHIKDAFKPRRRHLAERLSEPARRGSLPMQLGTGLTQVKTKVDYQSHAVWILPDGRVITAASVNGTYASTQRTFAGTSSASFDVSYSSSASASLTLMGSISGSNTMTTTTGATTSTPGSSDTTTSAPTFTAGSVFNLIDWNSTIGNATTLIPAQGSGSDLGSGLSWDTSGSAQAP